MIPAEAVEAAMRAWGVKGEDQRRIVETILEAAAPHMLAEVLEEAACAAEDPSPEDMDTYFIDQADVGRWLRDRAEAYRTPDAR